MKVHFMLLTTGIFADIKYGKMNYLVDDKGNKDIGDFIVLTSSSNEYPLLVKIFRRKATMKDNFCVFFSLCQKEDFALFPKKIIQLKDIRELWFAKTGARKIIADEGCGENEATIDVYDATTESWHHAAVVAFGFSLDEAHARRKVILESVRKAFANEV